mgnify:CR=1 FL=1
MNKAAVAVGIAAVVGIAGYLIWKYILSNPQTAQQNYIVNFLGSGKSSSNSASSPASQLNQDEESWTGANNLITQIQNLQGATIATTTNPQGTFVNQWYVTKNTLSHTVSTPGGGYRKMCVDGACVITVVGGSPTSGRFFRMM